MFSKFLGLFGYQSYSSFEYDGPITAEIKKQTIENLHLLSPEDWGEIQKEYKAEASKWYRGSTSMSGHTDKAEAIDRLKHTIQPGDFRTTAERWNMDEGGMTLRETDLNTMFYHIRDHGDTRLSRMIIKKVQEVRSKISVSPESKEQPLANSGGVFEIEEGEKKPKKT